MRIETIAVHAGRKTDSATGSVTPPIYLSTTFEREPDGEYPKGYVYTRSNNPNREALEKCLTELEDGKECASFSSGSAGTMSILQSLFPGDHIIASDDLYHGTRHSMKFFEKWDIRTTFVDMTNLKLFSSAFNEKTKLVWVETPSNPLLKIIDLEKISEITHNANAFVVCDNTWATPILQKPFAFDVDLILHATTKYIGGHSDILGGAVITREDNEIFRTSARFKNREEQCLRLLNAGSFLEDCRHCL